MASLRPRPEAIKALSEQVFCLSAERLQLAVKASPHGPRARILAFEAAYIILAAAAGCDESSFQNAPSEELAARGADALHLPKEDRELAEALTCIYKLPGWEQLDLQTMFEFVEVVTAFARRFGVALPRQSPQSADPAAPETSDFEHGGR